jgi:hypothetical protein
VARKKSRSTKKTTRSGARAPKLGRQLLLTIEEIGHLKAITIHEERLQELDEIEAQMIEQLADLIDENLDQQSAKYQAAAQGLRDASSTIATTIEGLESLANAIKALGKAADLVASLL